MNVRNRKLGVLVAGVMGIAAITPVSAELPSLSEKEWLGYFVGFQNRKFQFTVTSQGKAAIMAYNRKGEPLNRKLAIPVEFLVEEILPDGKFSPKKLKPDSLESTQPATDSPQNMVIKGKVTGDASFEAFIHEDRGVISLGGRLLDPGTLTKNPLRFSLRLKFPPAYPSAKKTGDKDDEKKFQDKIKGDRVLLTWTDGKRVKHDTDESVDAGSTEINGPGIAAMQVEFSSFDEKKLELVASPLSTIKLSGEVPAPLHDGFTITWMADPATDPDAKARLSVEVK